MIGLAGLDMMVRGGALALLVLWTWLLWRDHRGVPAVRIAIAMNLGIACHVVASVPGSTSGSALVDALFDIASTSVVGLFWLFARIWFQDAARIGWREWLVVAWVPVMVAILHTGLLDGTVVTVWLWFPLMRGIWLVLIVNSLWIAWKGRAGDLVEARRRLRLAIIAATGLLAVAVNIAEIAVFRFGADERWRSLPEVGVFLALLLLTGAMFAHRHFDLFQSGRPAADTRPETATDPLAARLTAHMARERPYRDETLTIAGLAAQLNEQEYRLRRTINGQLGQRNFAAFLNGYRLAEVKAALADPEQKDVPILTIALDAGFGSLGPFNRAFREAEGMTPTAYRRQAE